MLNLDWGVVTPEASNEQNNEFTYVHNHDLTTADKVDRSIRFLIGRLNFYAIHLPENGFHHVKMDIRGQQITDLTCAKIEQLIKEKYVKPDSIEITFVKK
jgi:hypothetical protein